MHDLLSWFDRLSRVRGVAVVAALLAPIVADLVALQYTEPGTFLRTTLALGGVVYLVLLNVPFFLRDARRR